MTGLQRRVVVVVFDQRCGEPHYDETRDDKAEQCGHQPLPVVTRDEKQATEQEP